MMVCNLYFYKINPANVTSTERRINSALLALGCLLKDVTTFGDTPPENLVETQVSLIDRIDDLVVCTFLK